MLRKLLLVIFVWTLPLLAEPAQMRESDVRRAMDRLFSLHIENKSLTPSLVKRCFKLYIEQFDPEKIYLLEQEVLPYLQISDATLNAMAERIKKEDYSDFFALNKTIQGAIRRAKEMRVNIGSELVLQNTRSDVPNSGALSRYAKSDAEIFERQQNRMVRFFLYHRSISDLSTAERRSKLLVLFDKKVERLENQYLFLQPNGKAMHKDRVENFTALRILKAFAKSLDTHTSFFSPEEAQEMRLSLEKQFEGVGVILFEGIDGVVISELVKGSPAEQSGKIRINDLLIEIDGVSVETASFEEVLDWLKKKEKTEIVLGFKRGKDTYRVALQKTPIVMNEERIETSYERFGDGVIGKIKLHSFYESSDGMTSERDIKEAIRSFQQIGPLYGLVLDLRENSGGFLSQAIKVSGLFLSNGVVAISKYGQGEIHYLRNIVGRSFFTGPLVVLTSKMSASASEIVAQALQDYGVGVIVGDPRTFGKGSIQYQTVTDEKASLFFKVTVGKYYTASGRTTQIEGVKADIVVPTHYNPYSIGERYLEYPLSADTVDPVFVDPLSDLDEKTKRLFERKYMPYLQRVVSFWKKMLPVLRKNSARRLSQNSDFQAMLQKQELSRERLSRLPPNSIDESSKGTIDLPMAEAVNIVRDMIQLDAEQNPQGRVAEAAGIPQE